jgi:penicillin-binding protein 1B
MPLSSKSSRRIKANPLIIVSAPENGKRVTCERKPNIIQFLKNWICPDWNITFTFDDLKGHFVIRFKISLLLVIGIGLIAGAVWLGFTVRDTSEGIEKRFAGRLWRIPSTVYSDTTILFPGQGVNLNLFSQKLRQLGYRDVSALPSRKGELHIGKGTVDCFLQDIHTPIIQREGFPVRIEMSGGILTAIRRLDSKEDLPLLELEPEELTRYFGEERERRMLVSINDVPKHLIDAVLAAEDHRFYDHYGIDWRGIIRAFITNIREGSIRQGGSTLTQQLAKNYFLTPDRTYKRKLREILISLILEYRYDKNQILEIYLNEIYWGHEGPDAINGIGEAAKFYFGKPVSDLSVEESAVLAGMIKAPNHFSPFSNRTDCLNRRDEILLAMHTRGSLSDEAFRTAMAASINFAAPASFERRAPYFIDYLSKQLVELYSPDVLSSQGMAIHTTLDTQVQMAAETALTIGLERLESRFPALKKTDPKQQLQGAVVVLQPKTGSILAMVGGRSYRESQFNRAVQAARQTGSALKPFVYAAALDRFTSRTALSNTPRDYIVNGKPWRPKNYETQAEPVVTLREALATSQNIATINLAYDIGLDRVAEVIRSFGLTMPEHPYPAMVLGATEVVPLDLALGYCVFAADGVAPNPMSLKEVVDESGTVIEGRHANIRRVLDPASAYLMNDLLESVVTFGTARNLSKLGISWPVAGKTGTTNDSKDGWFVGYTPDILALVWVGFDNGDSIQGTGSQAAMPIWAELMKQIPGYVSGGWFQVPPGVVRLRVCAESGQLAGEGCPHPIDEIFLTSNAPTKPCELHAPQNLIQDIWEGFKKYVQ